MITLPMAPSDGLFLDKPSFDRYNGRAAEAASGLGGSLDWEAEREAEEQPGPGLTAACLRERIRAFKDEHIVGHITREVRIFVPPCLPSMNACMHAMGERLRTPLTHHQTVTDTNNNRSRARWPSPSGSTTCASASRSAEPTRRSSRAI